LVPFIHPRLFFEKLQHIEFWVYAVWWAGLFFVAMYICVRYPKRGWGWIFPIALGFAVALALKNLIDYLQYPEITRLYFFRLGGSVVISVPAAGMGVKIGSFISRRQVKS